MASAAFEQFKSAQTHVNNFLWSAELGLVLVKQNLIKGANPAIALAKRFGELYPLPHAFVKNNKSRLKYNPRVSLFEKHLVEDFESLCRYVIIRFHSALELYLWLRVEPFLALDGLNAKQRKSIQKVWQGTDYRRLQSRLESKVSSVGAIDPDVAALAEAYRMLRNSIVHLQKETFFDVAWSDGAFRKKIESTFHGQQKTMIIAKTCDGIKKYDLQRTPALFFYALFMLTNYRNFAMAVENALPQSP